MTLVGPELKAGDKAPDFTALDNGLKPVHSERYRAQNADLQRGSVTRYAGLRRADQALQRRSRQAGDVDIYTVSMDLPFAQKRFCNSFALDKVKMLSDHKDASFGSAYGTLIKELRILSRAIFVVGPDDKLKYVEYVPEVSQHPNYEAALAAAKS